MGGVTICHGGVNGGDHEPVAVTRPSAVGAGARGDLNEALLSKPSKRPDNRPGACADPKRKVTMGGPAPGFPVRSIGQGQEEEPFGRRDQAWGQFPHAAATFAAQNRSVLATRP
jgi:hypothetical protein